MSPASLHRLGAREDPRPVYVDVSPREADVLAKTAAVLLQEDIEEPPLARHVLEHREHVLVGGRDRDLALRGREPNASVTSRVRIDAREVEHLP